MSCTDDVISFLPSAPLVSSSDDVCECPQNAIREEAEELLSEKRVISGAINIRTNKDKMKARSSSFPIGFYRPRKGGRPFVLNAAAH